MHTKRHSWLLSGAGVAFALLMLILVVGALGFWADPAPAAIPSGWLPVFEDRFETLTDTLATWTISDNITGTYQWGWTTYTDTTGVTETLAGGGTLGQEQSCCTGTYTQSLDTWAIAGPFTTTQTGIWGARAQLRVQNAITTGDTLFIGLSLDGETFEGITLTEVLTGWQTVDVAWNSTSPVQGAQVWLGLRFVSGGEGVAVGPLVDDVRLEFNHGYKLFAPAIHRDPTPTPSPTPSPTPVFLYYDDFSDPESGWRTGDTARYNFWDPNHPGWEVVANITYTQSHYQIYIPLSRHSSEGGEVDSWWVWPAMAAPLPETFPELPTHYCIEARGSFVNGPGGEYRLWWSHWGIVFAANEDMTDLYTFQINDNRDRGVVWYPRYVYPGNNNRRYQDLTPPDYETNREVRIIDWAGQEHHRIYAGPAYNTIKVVRRGYVADFYVNDYYLFSTTFGSLPQAHIGLTGGNWEITPTDIWIDYFRYEPHCPESYETP